MSNPIFNVYKLGVGISNVNLAGGWRHLFVLPLQVYTVYKAGICT